METTTAAPERQQLVHDLRDLILESVNLKHRSTDDITEATSLMANGLELDSIDILEIVVAVEQRYQVKIKDGEDGKHAFRTIGTIADFISSHAK